MRRCMSTNKAKHVSVLDQGVHQKKVFGAHC